MQPIVQGDPEQIRVASDECLDDERTVANVEDRVAQRNRVW